MAKESASKVPPCTRCQILLILMACVLVAVVIVLAVHFSLQAGNNDTRSDVIVNCHPEPHPTGDACTKRGCKWAPMKMERAPSCTFPSAYGYKMVGEPTVTSSGMKVELERMSLPEYLPGSPDINNVYLSVEYRSDYSLRLRFYPKNGKRWEIPSSMLKIPSMTSTDDSGHLYKVGLVREPHFGVIIKRKSTNQTIWNSTLPGFVYSDQFLQLTTRLASDNFYGLGEHNHRQFNHNMNWKTWPIFARDLDPKGPWNLYGAHPVYLNVEDKDGNSHMVFLKNSNAMEVALQPSPHPAVTFRTIGGVLDFYIFLGPSPGEAVSQYTETVGRPVMPPYWALGYHLSRWGYTNITDMKMVVDRNRAAHIPYDGQWGDIDIMYKNYVFSYDRERFAGLPSLVKDLHTHHQKMVVFADPGVGSDPEIIAAIKDNSPGYNMYSDGVKEGVLVMKSDNSGPIIAKESPGPTAYVDFSHPKSQKWWRKWAAFLRNSEGIKFDCLWIDLNEPTSFVAGSLKGCANNKLNNPPYAPNIFERGLDGRLYNKTLCMDAKHHKGRSHYDLHNLYGHLHSMKTYNILKKIIPGKRPWTMTRSSFAGTGKFATKWMGDNEAHWDDMKWSIIAILEFGLFGFSLNGADICGFWYEAEYEMCIRWHQLGAFYPFARNHNAKMHGDNQRNKHQDPGAFDERFQRIVRDALLTRYKLLPYLYTLMHVASTKGHTVMRSLLFEFPSDQTTLSIYEQFLLGQALLISPVLHKDQTEVKAYFPKARWYDFFTGKKIIVRGDYGVLDTPLDKFNVHIRGGYVVPWQSPSVTTAQSRNGTTGAAVALGDDGKAHGELFWDDGESLDTFERGEYLYIQFEMSEPGILKLTPTTVGYKNIPKLDTLDIYGLETKPDTVTVDGANLGVDKTHMSKQIVQLKALELDLTSSHVITWTVAN